MSEPVRARATSVDWGWLASMAPRVAVVGMLAGWALAVASGSGAKASPEAWGGDYPAFHTAGRIALDGRLADLYDYDVQDAYQKDLPREGLLPFLYPPFVAAAYAPLAMLPYRAAYAVHTVVALAALAASLLLLAPLSPSIRRDPWLAAAFVLLFYPMCRAVLGGQNTAFSVVIVCAAWRLFHDGRDAGAGLVLGLLAYKPQFLVPVAGVVLLCGRKRAVVASAAAVALLAAVSTVLAGWSWPAEWLRMLASYAGPDRRFNAHASISLGQISDWIAALFGSRGWSGAWVVLSAALSLVVAGVALRSGRRDFFGVLAIALVAALVIPPHAMYYDAGIALPAAMLAADRGRLRETALFWLGGALQLVAAQLPLSPVLFVLLAVLFLQVRALEADA